MKVYINIILKPLLLIALFAFGATQNGNSQSNNYIQLFDYSGEPNTNYINDLQIAADSLVAAFPTAYQDSFKVYDFGFYLHQEDYDGFSYPEEFVKVVRDLDSKYYLAFGRQTDESGMNTKTFVEVKVPGVLFDCLGEDFLLTLQTEMEYLSNLGSSNIYNNQSNAIEEAKSIIASVITCCDTGTRSSDCPLCVYEEEQNVRKLKQKGYVEIEQSGFDITVDNYVVTNLVFTVAIPLEDGGYSEKNINYLDEINQFKADDPSNVFYQIDYLTDQCELESLEPAAISNYLYGEHTVVFNDNGRYRFFFKINASFSQGSRSGGDRALFSVAAFLVKRAILGGVNVAVGLMAETAFSKWIDGNETYGEAWDNLEINYWNVFLDFAEGAISPNIPPYVQFGLNVFRASILYVLDVGVSGFEFEEFVNKTAESAVQVTIMQFVLKAIPFAGNKAGAFGRIWAKNNPQLYNKVKSWPADVLFKYVNDIFTRQPGQGWLSVFDNIHLFIFRAKAWRSLFSKPTWRTNTDYLSKVSRYTDEGLEIVEEGGDLIVKQADGVKVGKLDPNDPYYPGEMKVKGESSGRWFDPDDAGGPIVKKSWTNPTFNQSGIDDVSTHVARFTDAEAVANNNFMINRLNQIKNGQRVPDDFDKRFYTHELEEFARFQNKGIPNGSYDDLAYQNTHTASLESYNINELVEKIYPPNVPFPSYAGY